MNHWPRSWADVEISAAARTLGQAKILTRARSFRFRAGTDPAPQNRRRKFVASVTFLSFKSRERWHYPPCKRTAMRPVRWSAQVAVARERMQR